MKHRAYFKLWHLAVMTPLMVSACGKQDTTDQRNTRTAMGVISSSVLSIALPTGLTSSDGKSAVTGYHIALNATPSLTLASGGCEFAKIDFSAPIAKATAQQILISGCDYVFDLELGALAPSGDSLSTVYYSNKDASGKGQELTHETFDGKDTASVQVQLALTHDGLNAGFGRGGEGDSIVATPPVKDSVQIPTPPPTNPPGGTVPGTLLRQELRINLTKTDGSTVKLEDTFDTDYLVVDFSQAGCVYCKTMAQEHDGNTTYQKRFAKPAAKCTFVTVVPDVGAWATYIGGGWSSQHSYKPSVSSSQLAKNFGFNLTGTPTTIITDKTGKIIKSVVGGEPAEIQTLCK